MSLSLPPDLSGLSYLRLDGHLLIRPENLDAFVQQKVEAAVQRVEARYQGGLLTTKEVCKLLAVSSSTLSALVLAGRIACVRYGEKSYRFRREDVETFIQSHTVSVRLCGLERLQALTGVPRPGRGMPAPMAYPAKGGTRRRGPRKGITCEDLAKLGLKVDGSQGRVPDPPTHSQKTPAS